MTDMPPIVIIIVLPSAGESLAPVGVLAGPDSAAAVGLSVREREILAGVAAGECNKKIGTRLGIGADTVKAHLRSIFKKIGVQNRTQAALWAVDNRFFNENGC